jgi:3-isopropylmalate/(R)-2-methylmalate dehydratase small subunit
MLNGLDDIGLTLEKSGNVEAFEQKIGAERPWL